MENQKLDFPNSSCFVLLHNFLPILITPSSSSPDYGFVWWSSHAPPAHSLYPIPISPVTPVLFHFLSLQFSKHFHFQSMLTNPAIHSCNSKLFHKLKFIRRQDHVLDCCTGLLVGPAFPFLPCFSVWFDSWLV